MTDFIPPMLAKAIKLDELGKKRWDDYIIEPKHDGMRAIAIHDLQDNVRFYGRSGIEYTAHVPHLVNLLKQCTPPGTVIDGELAIISSMLHWDYNIPVVNFNKTMRIMGGLAPRAIQMQQDSQFLSFIVWDAIWYAGTNLVSASWIIRRSYIEKMGLGMNRTPHLVINPYWHADNYFEGIEGAFNDLVSLNVEGIILKNKLSLYLPNGRRANTWYKLKLEKTFDVVVMGATKGQGKYKDMIGALEFGAYDTNGELVYVGKCSGMTDEERQMWTKYLFDNEDSTVAEVIEVKSNDLVGSGKFRTPRHPQYVRLRNDKKPLDCKLDQFLVED